MNTIVIIIIQIVKLEDDHLDANLLKMINLLLMNDDDDFDECTKLYWIGYRISYLKTNRIYIIFPIFLSKSVYNY